MTSKKTYKCKFAGCKNAPLKDRLFCAEHSADYGVPHVAAYRGHPATISLEPRFGKSVKTKRTTTISKGKHSIKPGKSL